jgi:hypothetical protein
VVRPSETHEVLDQEAVLVDLDRVHAAILALVVVLFDGLVEDRGEHVYAAPHDVGEAQQDGGVNSPALQLADQLVQVDPAEAWTGRCDHQVSLVVGVKEALPPAGDVVEVEAVFGGPAAQGIVGGENLGAGHRDHRVRGKPRRSQWESPDLACATGRFG